MHIWRPAAYVTAIIQKLCQQQTINQRSRRQWLTGRVRGVWSRHTLKGSMWTRCSQSELGHNGGHWPRNDLHSHMQDFFFFFSVVARLYSMTLMSASISSYYCSSHSYSSGNASSCVSIYDTLPLVGGWNPPQGNFYTHTESGRQTDTHTHTHTHTHTLVLL